MSVKEPPSTQITLKIPTAFLQEFDEITSQLGYPRNEAVREAMRRFLEWGFQKANERHPERQMELVQGMLSSLFGGLAQEAKKFEETTGELADKATKSTKK